MRIPTSRVRRLPEYEITPQIPTADNASAKAPNSPSSVNVNVRSASDDPR